MDHLMAARPGTRKTRLPKKKTLYDVPMFVKEEDVTILFNKHKYCVNEVLHGMSLRYAFCLGDSAVLGQTPLQHCDNSQ